jgi:large subunit ribosomal protein L15
MANKINLESNKKNIKRVGRGISAGGGKTAGRGTKGQNSRAGHNIPNRFEGGQTPLSMRLPKLPGFKKVNEKTVILTLDMISKNYKNGETVSLETLIKKGLIKKGQSVKVLSNGKLSIKIKIKDVPASKKALDLINAKDTKS